MNNHNIISSPLPSLEIPSVPLTHYLIEKWNRFPADKVALVDCNDGTEINFGKLISYINNVACHLHARGFKKGDVLAIYSPNHIYYPIAFHGTTLLGGVVTTVNPLYTVEELTNQLKDSKATFLVTLSMFADKAKEASAKVGRIKEIFCFDKFDKTTPFETLMNTKIKVKLPNVKINPATDPVVIPYSSGTTGLPKGVVLTHRNLTSNLLQVLSVECHGPTDVTIGVLPFFHIYAMLILMNCSLYQGMKVVVMPKFELQQYLELVQKYRVTIAYLVPPVILALAKHPMVDKYDLSSLRVVFSGAAPLGAETEDGVRKRLKVTVKQGYGMTEMSPVTHISPYNRSVSGSVGVLLPNLIAKVVDDKGNALPLGKEGELWVSGPNMMKGYLNRPDATKAMIDQDGFLHTGDVARVDENGYFYIVDRVKELIKYKGFQVAPAELEEIIISHPSLCDAAVIPVQDEEAGELPKAYVVIKPGHTVTAEEIHSWIENKVAPHKRLRGGIQFTDQIPKSPSGKILRRFLVTADREQREALKAKL